MGYHHYFGPGYLAFLGMVVGYSLLVVCGWSEKV
jgi:hypothetical protein